MSKFIEAVKQIRSTRIGQERNMYPYVKTIFEALGHSSKNIIVDTASESGSGIPDLYILASMQIKINNKTKMGEWLVCEVKDERDAFATAPKREKIFSEKAKYISLDTSYFVMIDPTCLIIRPIIMRSQKEFDISNDIVIKWSDVEENGKDWFIDHAMSIHIDNSGVNGPLKSFRNGDASSIATIDLTIDEPTAPSHTRKRHEYVRNDFYSAIRKSTEMLQSSCLEALEQLRPDIENLHNILDEFGNNYGGDYQLELSPFFLRGKTLSAETAKQHDEDVEKIRQEIFKNPSIGKLALLWLPEFKNRVGKVEFAKKDLTYELFATETANLILARILLLRFFEDHGFFGEKRYICNGGVKAFQEMRNYFDLSYTKLLKDVYDKAKSIYFNVFDEMELDWIFGTNNEQLSLAIELSLMYLSRFNFQTVKGDILTGIYDRFMSGNKRKRMGEYFTPPSVARYMIDRLNINAQSKIYDPSCGSGTFPIEVFQKAAGETITAGVGDYDLAQSTLKNIAANDLNPFSAMLTQIQLLWHLLPLREELASRGFPRLRVSEKHNSLIPAGLGAQALFAEIDKDKYDAVLGNPPYVRPERSDQELPKDSQEFYKKDLTPSKNLFTLFIYRALKSWCKPNGEGTLAFVVPLSLCDNNTNSPLRELFQIGKRWRIREIVDMEAISDKVFDASVNPIIFIADTKMATQADTVTIRIAGKECVDIHGNIDLNKSTQSSFAYKDIWSQDGRILTKITQNRLPIIKKLLAHQTFKDIAYTFWVRKEKNKIIEWQKEAPQKNDQRNWSEKISITRGAVFRGKKPRLSTGYDIYKGENISLGVIEGEPQETNIDIQNVDDPSIWKFLNVLPDRAFAFLRISSGPTATPFNPHEKVFLDTASLFIPKEPLQDFPFDLLMLSSVYRFFYGVYSRMGAVEEMWSNHYPTNLSWLPWNENLTEYTHDIENLREEYLQTCKAMHNRADTLLAKLHEVETITFQRAVADSVHLSPWSMEWNGMEFGESHLVSAKDAKFYEHFSNGSYLVQLGESLHSWIGIGDKEIAKRFRAVLTILDGREIKREDIIKILLPKEDTDLQNFMESVEEYDSGNAFGKFDTIVKKIDDMVCSAFEISEDEKHFIQEEMATDSFLRYIKPSLPFTGKKKRGLLAGLGESTRYQ